MQQIRSSLRSNTSGQNSLPRSLSVKSPTAPRLSEALNNSVTITAEHAIGPLIQSVTILEQIQDGETLSQMKKGCSKKVKTSLQAIDSSVDNLIRQMELCVENKNQLLKSNPELNNDYNLSIQNTKESGIAFHQAVEFMCTHPLSPESRINVTTAGRQLIFAVSYLLGIADTLDLSELSNIQQILRENLDNLLLADNQPSFGQCVADVTTIWQHIDLVAASRNADLLDSRSKDELSAARLDLKRSIELLLAAGKAYLHNANIPEAVEARNCAFNSIETALARMLLAATGKMAQRPINQALQPRSGPPGVGDLEADVEEFQEQISIDPLSYDEARMRPFFEARLESVISGAAHVADSHCTREEHRQQIVNECNMLRQALQDLLREYAFSVATGRPSDMIPQCMENMLQKMTNLRVHLCRAVTDNVSDCFVDPAAPLLALMSAAQQGDNAAVERYNAMFNEHCTQMLAVSRMSCAISSDDGLIRAVAMAVGQLYDLSLLMPPVARLVCQRVQSPQVMECAEVYKTSWLDAVFLLMGGIDSLTAVDDFFAICEDHILEDVNKCVAFLQQGDAAAFEQSVALVRARVLRLCQRLTAYADSLSPDDPLVERLRMAAAQLNDVALPAFLQIASTAMKALATGQLDQVDENAVVESARQLYESSADACRILGPPPDMGPAPPPGASLAPSESMVDVFGAPPPPQAPPSRASSRFTEQEDIVRESMAPRESMAAQGPSEREQMVMAWSAEQREQIREQIEYFRQERMRFNKEVGKWDEAGNELIQLAKQMCAIMMEMTDFTRNRGPLRTVMDVIAAARRISDLGQRLDRLARSVGDQCPDSITKKDLFAYLQRITLHCHQLSICSKVKADVENISGELAAHHSLESATSLIQAARNLMEAVVLTVKSCYVASTKYSRLTGNRPVIQWRMKPPTKKPIYQPPQQPGTVPVQPVNGTNGSARHDAGYRNGYGMNGNGGASASPVMAPSQKPRMRPVDALGEFDHDDASN